eukprot:6196723-Pleurochrysis_carterae.AAC.1
MEQEAVLLDDPEEKKWLVKYSVSPIPPAALPVQGVLFGRCRTTADAQKCPSGTLRGRVTCNVAAAECRERGWE